jgi:hypothetical protein
VHRFGEILSAELSPLALGEPFQDFEVADPQPVLLAELVPVRVSPDAGRP